MTTEQECSTRREPPPIPIYAHQMGVVFASFTDGSIWLQDGPESWKFVRKIAGWRDAVATPRAEAEDAEQEG